MKRIYTRFYMAAALLCLNALTVSAQYCSPTFLNGCFSWRNQAITLDAINWTIGSSLCSESDYTTDTAYLDAGSSYPMGVMSGDWCGCAVWIDFNNDFAFDSTENLFYSYLPNQTNNYNFNISIPALVPTGIYRMRVMAGWGTDCYTASANGYGPCGSYQYGNFDDFTVSISSLPTAITEQEDALVIEASPNPVTDLLTVTIPDFKDSNARLQLTDITGRLLYNIPVTGKNQELDFTDFRRGVYFLNYSDGTASVTLRIVK